MHRAHDVLKARVFGRGKYPPGGLQLMDLPQPLDPRVIDDLPSASPASETKGT